MESLASMLPSCFFFLMQVLDVSIVDNKPTVEIVVDDAEFYVGTFQNWSIGGGVVI